MAEFEVWLKEEGYSRDDAKRIDAYDAEVAAEEYAEEYDCGDYALLKGDTIEVCVAEVAHSCVQVFKVKGSAPPSYSAELVQTT